MIPTKEDKRHLMGQHSQVVLMYNCCNNINIMKQLEKIVLHEAVELTDDEMKHVIGGSGSAVYYWCVVEGECTFAACKSDDDCKAMYGSGYCRSFES